MKKVFIIFGLSFMVLGIFIWLTNYLSTGSITITTGDKASSITLRYEDGGRVIKTGLGSLSTNVGHGDYVAEVKSDSRTSLQNINFKRGHGKFIYHLSPVNLKTVEPVTFQTAQNLTIDNNQLVYVDGSFGSLDKIDNQNNLSVLSVSPKLQIARWVNPSLGIGQSTDGRLYSIVNGSLSLLQVPFAYDQAPVSFDIAPNGQIYISHGGNVYSDTKNNVFKKIYTAKSNPILTAGSAGVAIASGVDVASVKPELALVFLSGRVIKAGIGADRLAWSPDSKYLVISDEDDSGGAVYNDSLQPIGTIPADNAINSVRWLDNNSLVYSTTYKLWKFNLQSQRSDLLEAMPLTDSILELTISGDRSYIYMVTANSNSNYSVRRVGLNNQLPYPELHQVEGFLPLNLADCSLNLINFTGAPAFLLQKFPDSSVPQQACLQEANNGLQQNGFGVNKLSFHFGP